MNINIATDSGINKLQEELDRVQQRSKARNITPEEIIKAAQSITDYLKITKRALDANSM